MPEPNFTIYQTATGYTAVTSEARQAILDALEEGDKELPDLVEATGRSKSTLSSVHMKELLERGIVEEHPHPTDGRKKRYRLVGRRIGSSELPLEELRSAVKEYVTHSPMAARLPIATALRAIGAAPQGVDGAILHAQGRALGEQTAHLFEGTTDLRSALMEVVSLLEREELARARRIDLEARALELSLGEALSQGVDDGQAAQALAGFLHGLLSGHVDESVTDVQATAGQETSSQGEPTFTFRFELATT